MSATALDPCTRCESPLEHGDLRCAVCGARAPAILPDANQSVTVEILRCQGCAAAVTYSAELQAAHCAFCDAVLELEKIEDPMEQTELYLPFTSDAGEAKAGIGKWYDDLGFFKAQDLSQKARVEEVRPLWWVGWVFQAEALISWAADSNAGSGRSAWAPHSGQVPMDFERVLVSASRGLSRDETWDLSKSYDLRSGQKEPQGGPENAVIEQFDVQRSMARGRVTRALENVAADRVERQHVPGSSIRNLHVAALLNKLETFRFAFPAWVVAYRYKNKLYRVVVSGQDASCVSGNAPNSWLRILAVVLGSILLVAAIAAGILIALGQA